MLSAKQETFVAQAIKEITDLQIKSKIIESHKAKGMTQTEDEQDLQTAMENIRARVVELAKLLAQMFESKGFEFFAQRLENQAFSPATMQKDISEMNQILADMKRESEKRLERNIRRRMAIEKAQKQAEQTNEKIRSKQESQKIEALSAAKKMAIPEESYLQIGRNGMAQTRFTAFPPSLVRFAGKAKQKRRKPNLIQVKSSEAKAKDLANQRALRKSEMSMTRSAPAMAPSQMSR